MVNAGNAYYDFFPALASHGIEVRAFDQRYVVMTVIHLLSLFCWSYVSLYIPDNGQCYSDDYHTHIFDLNVLQRLGSLCYHTQTARPDGSNVSGSL